MPWHIAIFPTGACAARAARAALELPRAKAHIAGTVDQGNNVMAAHSAEVTAATFEQEVLLRSRTVPVLTDFWAPWCGPCQMLMPVLARLSDEYAGGFFLAKVNTDAEQALATRFGVRSLPTVKLFKNAAVVDEFMGVQPERSIRALLDRHVARASDADLEQAQHALTSGQIQEATALLEQATSRDPNNARLRIELVRLYFEQGRLDEGEQLLRQLSSEERNQPPVQTLFARLEFLRVTAAAPSVAELESQLASHPNNHQARLQLAARLALTGQHEPALEELLELVRRDRVFGDDAGRRGALTVFNLLGGQGDLVKRYRARLSAAIH